MPSKAPVLDHEVGEALRILCVADKHPQSRVSDCCNTVSEFFRQQGQTPQETNAIMSAILHMNVRTL